MIIVGERLNSSRKSVLEALERRDEQFLLDQAVNQERAGASYIDINAAALMDAETPTLRWAIPLLQKNIRVPLSLDTPNPEAMEAALKIHKGRALLNSLAGDAKCLQALIPLIRDFKPRVIALCLDENGPPESSDCALFRAEKMANLLVREGMSSEDIFIDPLVRPIGVDSNSGALFLESVEKIKKNLPDVKTIAGLSNVSFGLPQRRQLNRTFLALALSRGLDAAICDPLDEELQATLHAAQALLGKDPSLKKYLKAVRETIKSRTEGRSRPPQSG
jgi:5-methyltetrahydrofolate--homocysteine methyltransferase